MKKTILMIGLCILSFLNLMFSQTLVELEKNEAEISWLLNQYVAEVDGAITMNKITDFNNHLCIIELSSYYDFDLIKIKTKKVFGVYSDLILSVVWTYDIDDNFGKHYYTFYDYHSFTILLMYSIDNNVCIFSYSSAQSVYNEIHK